MSAASGTWERGLEVRIVSSTDVKKAVPLIGRAVEES